MPKLREPLRFMYANGLPKAQLYIPIGWDMSDQMIFGYHNIDSMSPQQWQNLKTEVTKLHASATGEEKEDLSTRLNLIKLMMKELGFDDKDNPPVKDMSHVDIMNVIFSNDSLQKHAAMKFYASSETDKKKVTKFLETFNENEKSRQHRQEEFISRNYLIQFPGLIMTQDVMTLLYLREYLTSSSVEKSQKIKELVKLIDEELEFRKKDDRHLRDVENECNLEALKESRKIIAAYIASRLDYFKDEKMIMLLMRNEALKPYHMLAGRVMKYLQELLVAITNRIDMLSLTKKDNRYTIQSETCIRMLRMFQTQLNEWFTNKPNKQYALHLAYVMPALGAVEKTLENTLALYTYHEGRLGKNKEFKLKVCKEYNRMDDKKIKEINEMEFDELVDTYNNAENKHKIALFADKKSKLEEEMEYVIEVMKARLEHLHENDLAVPKQTVEAITRYTEIVAGELHKAKNFMEELYKTIHKIKKFDYSNLGSEGPKYNRSNPAGFKGIHDKELKSNNASTAFNEMQRILGPSADNVPLDEEITQILIDMSTQVTALMNVKFPVDISKEAKDQAAASRKVTP